MKRNQVIVLLSLLLAAWNLAAQTQDWQWANSAGGSVDLDSGYSIAVDSAGNSYVTGFFRYTASFGTTSYSSTGGSSDIFVAKLSPTGDWLWVKKAGGSGEDYGYGVAVDMYGNCYITGQFSLTASFGTNSVTSAGGLDVFAAKLDTNGNWLWARSGGGTGNDIAYAIAALADASQESCYVAGVFNGTANFGTHSVTSAGSTDAFIAKVDISTNWSWANRGGGTGEDCATGISGDSAGHCFVSGYFNGTAAFGGVFVTSSGSKDLFVGLADNAGNWAWVRHATDSGNDEAWDVATDGNGNSYVTGDFFGTATFGTTTLNSYSGLDIFIAKLDFAGNWLWAKRGGGSTFDYGYGISADSAGNVYVTGEYWAPIDIGHYNLTGIGGRDFFVAKLDTNGNWLWLLEGGSTSNDTCAETATDGNGNCYITGTFRGTCHFGALSVTSSGNSDIYIAKIHESTSSGIPLAPQNLTLDVSGNNVLLNWDDVTQDTDLNPVTIDHYLVYYRSESPSGTWTVFGADGSITSSAWSHSGAALSPKGFYRVAAVAGG